MQDFNLDHAMASTGAIIPALFVVLILTFALSPGSANAISTVDTRDNPALKELSIKFSIAPTEYPRLSEEPMGARIHQPYGPDNLVPTSHVTERNLINSPFAKSLRKLFFPKK